MRTEDGYIISQCLNGDHDAFGLLVDKYKAGVYALAYSRLRNFHDAEDIAQEAFIKAYKKLHTLRQWDSFAGWLYRIVTNLCTKWLKENIIRPDNEYVEEKPSNIYDIYSMESYQMEQVSDSIREAISSLSEEHREVIMLHYFGGMTSYEISQFLGISSSAIRRRLLRARMELKEELLDTISETFEKRKLPSIFTLRVLEITKHIRIQPMPREFLTHLGSSLLGILTLAILGTCTNLMIVREPYNVSAVPELSGVAGTGEIPVHAIDKSMIPSGGGASISNGNSARFSPQENNVLSILPSEIQTLWSKYPENPILIPGPQEWDSQLVGGPDILYDGKGYKMWYSGYDGKYWRVGYATSSDGITWDKHPNPALDVGSGTILDGILYPIEFPEKS